MRLWPSLAALSQSLKILDHGVTICFEMHGGDMIYNPSLMMRVRDEIGPTAPCNFDMSNLWYQGIDPSDALRYVGDIVQQVHAKVIGLRQHHIHLQGLMDNSSPENPAGRSWNCTLSVWEHSETSGQSLLRRSA